MPLGISITLQYLGREIVYGLESDMLFSNPYISMINRVCVCEYMVYLKYYNINISLQYTREAKQGGARMVKNV